MTTPLPDSSAGLGLRRALLGALQSAAPDAFDFLECAPDNWIGVGGRYGEALAELVSRHTLTCHGLSLSLGGVAPLDETFLARVRRFLDRHKVALYSEHLSYCTDDGHLYDLMPIPFTEEAVRHVAARIRRVQDLLGRRIAVENVSYYAAPHRAMDEIDFVNAVLAEADCDLLLDVNNIYVNAINHGYDAHGFLARMPTPRIASYHIAGHYHEADDLKVDTHGAAVKEEVWSLLQAAYRVHGVRPTLLERDFNFPAMPVLLAEVERIRVLQRAAGVAGARAAHAEVARQYQLAAHLRDPDANPPPPGIEDRRLAIYRELFFNNIEGLLAGNFPVIRKTLGDARWRELARGFYAHHRSHTPLFAEIGREFIRFLQERAQAAADDPAWLAEMAHYEWVELGLQINDDEIPAHQSNGDLLAGVPVLSPTAWALAYTWPVPHIGPDYQPTTAPDAPTLVLVRRDRQYEIRFAEISPLVYRLIELLRGGELGGHEALEQLAREAGVTDLPAFIEQGAAMLQRMHEEGTILGTRLVGAS